MPWYRCTDKECGHSWFQRFGLDDEPECPECGEPAALFDPGDDDPTEAEQHADTRTPRIAFARELARKRLADADVAGPPVPVHELARAEGLQIVPRKGLGTLRGRLVGDTIELAGDDHEVVQRFTIAHELGHRALAHQHGDGAWAETEADHYANELLVPGQMLSHKMASTTSAAALRRCFNVSRPVLEIACKHHRCADRLTD